MSTETKTNGTRNDLPAAEDLFSVESHRRGLSDFVRECATPMTISAHGDWGAGKTTFLKLVENDLSADRGITTIFVDTWAYSQFSLGESLVFSILEEIGKNLPGTESDGKANAWKARFLRNWAKAARIVLKAGAAALDTAAPGAGRAATVAVKAVAAGAEAAADEVPSPSNDEASGAKLVELLKEMRNDFAEAVKQSGQRVVIMIDDLDRVEPAKAVELLEVIKIFLETENCVFVLAIDFEVVKLGVQQKYGDKITEGKAQAFFDKIIQTPFAIPVHAYSLDSLFEGNFDDRGATLAVNAVGSNPRAIKRLLNSYSLNKRIFEARPEKEEFSGKELEHLFAVQCLEVGKDELFRSLVSNRFESTPGAKFLQALKPSQSSSPIELNTDSARRPLNASEKYVLSEVRQWFSNEDAAFVREFDSAILRLASSGAASSGNRRGLLTEPDEMLRKLREKRGSKWDSVAKAFLVNGEARGLSLAAQNADGDTPGWTVGFGITRRRVALISFQAKNIVFSIESDKISKMLAPIGREYSIDTLEDSVRGYLREEDFPENKFDEIRPDASGTKFALRFTTAQCAEVAMQFLGCHLSALNETE